MTDDSWPIIVKVQKDDDDPGTVEHFHTPQIAREVIDYWRAKGWMCFTLKGRELLRSQMIEHCRGW